MSSISRKVKLGETGLTAGRLGISSSFGAPAAAFEMAFERGCNYFTWGTFIKGRSSAMRTAIQNIIRQGSREQLILAMYTYAHSAYLTEKFLLKGLRVLKTPFADILILGFFPSRPPQRIIEGALNLKRRGLVRYLGISSHNRKVFPKLLEEDIFDIFHLRYNAANRGAEQDIFPFLTADTGPEVSGSVKNRQPGIVSFTATRHKSLLNPKKMPPGENPPTAQDCYRFVLSNPHIHICMMGARTLSEMEQNLNLLEMDLMSDQEMARMRKIGDYVYGR
jgi:aryl-alcohol dehydrogenase-like predicted oxidoreductase